VFAMVEQMQSVAKGLGRDPKNSSNFITELIKKLDKNGDGKISKDEFFVEGLKSPALLCLLGA
jgi:hypothetical protein